MAFFVYGGFMPERVGDGIPIPDVIDPPESMSMTLCIPKNRDHMSAFFGALYQLTIWNSWQEDEAHNGKELAAVWWRYYLSWNRVMSDIDCEDGMSDCCTEPAISRRVNPTTGLLEQSTNGGATWTPLAGGINSYIVEPVPPVTSGVSATKCDAATNLSGQVEQWITQVSNDFDTATTLLEFATAVLTAILAAVLAILSAGTLTAVEALVLPTIAAALTAAWGAGKAVFDAYWTTEHKDAILCAAYCNIGDDGSFTDAQFSAFWNNCNVDLPPSPAKMLFMGFLSSVGRQGVNAMAASGLSADADCSDCVACQNCPDKWEIRFNDPSLGVITEVGDDYLIAETTTPQPNGVYYISMWTGESNYLDCCYVNSIEVLTGSAAVGVGVPCNDNGVPRNMLLPACMWWIEPQSNVPFSVRINLGDCP
jgi:hypothetical protein